MANTSTQNHAHRFWLLETVLLCALIGCGAESDTLIAADDAVRPTTDAPAAQDDPPMRGRNPRGAGQPNAGNGQPDPGTGTDPGTGPDPGNGQPDPGNGQPDPGTEQPDLGPGATSLPNGAGFANPAGTAASFSTTGAVDLTNPFFESLGENGRACVTCHLPSDGWALRPASAQALFDASQGTHPLFRTNDGSVCPDADVSTLAARRSAYALLLSKGLIRVGLGIPVTAEFELADSEGTYCNQVSNAELSLFRRPLPTTNLAFIGTVMWDGRETLELGDIHGDLGNQANGATLGHAEGQTPLSEAIRASIVGFETSLFTAQTITAGVGSLTARGGLGGPEFLSTVPFEIGINDDDHSPIVFTLFNAWNGGGATDGQAAVARGQRIFNNRTFRIQGVSGLGSNDVMGQCSTCHLTPNAGSHSSASFFDIGTAAPARRTPDLPLYTLRNKNTGATRQTSDPGRALITGRWADIGQFKPANLRALATRAPYFHDGSEPNLQGVVNFYNRRFRMGLNPQERADLVLFLQSL